MKPRNIKVITHNDLDGYMSAIVLETLMPYTPIGHISIETGQIIQSPPEDVIFEKDFISPNDVDKLLEEAIDGDKYDGIYVLDLCFSENMKSKVLESSVPIVVFDHHKTNLWANELHNKRKDLIVKVRVENLVGVKLCGTSLIYNNLQYILKDNLDKSKLSLSFIEDLVELVRLWDTWDWTLTNNKIPRNLNSLVNLCKDVMYDRFLTQCKKSLTGNLDESNSIFFEFTNEDKLLLHIDEINRTKYLESKLKSVEIIEVNIDIKYGVVYADRYISELGKYINDNLDISLLQIISDNTISLRTNKDNIDVSLIAKHMGGGGHTKAAGYPINRETKERCTTIMTTHLSAAIYKSL